MNMPAFAAKEKVVSYNNKFGGVTKVITYFEDDNYYKKGIDKVIFYYDNRSYEKLIEIFQISDYIEKTGSYKTLIYYKGKVKIFEILFTDIANVKKRYSKIVLYLTESNKLKKREYYFAEKNPIAMLGIYKRVVFYSNDGQINKVIHLDNFGNIAMVK